MNRLKLLAAAALLAVPLINACGDPTPPPITGTISGQVVIEGEQQAGVTVKLNTGATATTTSTGSFSFADVEANTYTVTISGFADDGSFDKTSQSATIANNGQKVTVNFTGSWIRTSVIMGEVTVEGTGLEGVTVKLTGMSEGEMVTSAAGAYSFTGLRAGVHTVEISGFDDEDIGFSTTSSVADVAIGATEELHFQASYLRASAVMGQVTVEGKGLAGVTVSLQGVDRDLDVGTNSGGQFNFADLRKGDYSIAISGYDTDEYGFEVTSQNLTVAYGETAEADFDGIALRTAAVSGAVTIEGTGLEGVTVSLTGEGEELSVVTNAAGQWTFTRLHAGSYSIGISGYDTDEYGFDETSASVTVALKETATADFDGIMLRTAAISGHVSIEGEPLAGITITVNGRGEEYTRTTDPAGNYTVDRLHAGDYTVTISGFDNDLYDFDPTVKSVSVGLRETADIGFDGIMLRTVEIEGTVTTDGDPLAGVTVTISGGRADETVTATTDVNGMYSVGNLHAGEYTVTVSDFDDDEYEFDPASQSITVELGETAFVGFPGVKLRTGGIEGTVTADDDPVAGVTVTISGGRADETVTETTGPDGMYSVDRLHAGEYTVTLSGFDDDEYEFPASLSATVELLETAVVDFGGVKLRTAGIFGAVAAEGKPLADVTVTVSGGRADETVTAVTSAAGRYSLERLHAGDYTVAISGYDEEEYEFDPAEQSVTVELQDFAEVSFEHGVPLRTASISGRVTMDGDAADDITITLSGEQDAEMETNANGQYNFPGLPAGDYTLAVTNPDAEEFEFTPDTVDVTLMRDEGMIQNFSGRSLRTVAITGAVTAEGEMIAGATANLYWVKSLTEVVPVVGGTQLTDSMGGYAFGGLLDNTYAVVLSGYDDEYDFPTIRLAGQEFVAWTGYVATDDTATANFTGTIVRTAMIGGEVTADGEALMDIEVTIEGDHAPDDNTMMTDADGMYMFDGLRKGEYTVSITNPDEEMYDFQTMERDVNVAVGQTQDDVSFAGSVLRSASISGQVNVDGNPLEDVAVVLSGDDSGETTTDANGEYNFPGLAGGDYVVSITNPDETRYAFGSTADTIDDLGSSEAEIVDFSGDYVYDASISGMLFLDEVENDGERQDDEPVFEGKAATMAKLILENEDGDMWRASADSSGSYGFAGLKAGMYTLMHDTASNAGLANAGYRFAGDSAGVSVDLTGTSQDTVDLPYRITKQTINVGAVMGRADTATATRVANAAFYVYPNLSAAQQGRDTLGYGKTATTGISAVTFARADDYGPGGPGTTSDGVVIVKIDGDSSSYHADLKTVHKEVEVAFEFTERTTHAAESFRLVNTASKFRWSVMSAARDVGGEYLTGWKASVWKGTRTTGTATFDSVPTRKVGAANYAEVTQKGIHVDSIPRKYTIKLDATQSADKSGEKRGTPGTLSYTHTGLNLPTVTDHAGAISVHWTTQSLYLGFYREVDGRPGFTTTWVGGGDVPLDHRPVGNHLSSGTGKVSWTFRAPRASDGRYVTFKWDHDGKPKTADVDANGAAKWLKDPDSAGNYWIVRFPKIPTDTELEIRLTTIGTGKSRYSGGDVINAFGSDLDRVTNPNGVFNTFGTGGGGHPEMWLCGESSGNITPANGREDCITHGYQWKNNTVKGEFWARAKTGKQYNRTALLAENMTVTIDGISPTANLDTVYKTKKRYTTTAKLNDGKYVLRTNKTTRYMLDSASYTYKADDYKKVDTAGYLDTLFVFYQEAANGDRAKGAYNRNTIFKVTNQRKGADATLNGLRYQPKGATTADTVPGFVRRASGDKSYDLVVGWNTDTVSILTNTVDSLATVVILNERGDTLNGKDSRKRYILKNPTGKSVLKRAGRTTTLRAIVTAENDTATATHTIAIYRTTDRIKVEQKEIRKVGRLTKTYYHLLDLRKDTADVIEGDSTDLRISLWAKPTTGNNVMVTFGDSTDGWTFTPTTTSKTYRWKGAEDTNGEDEGDTLVAAATGGATGHAGTDTLYGVFLDNDVKQFFGPTEVSALEGVGGEGHDNQVRTPIVTNIGTEPTASIGLAIVATSGGSASTQSVNITQGEWNSGATFHVYGDNDGRDFEVRRTPTGGGYRDVRLDTIEVDWIDSTNHRVLVKTQEAKVIAGDTITTGVVLWKRGVTDSQGRTIIDSNVQFDSLDIECPARWRCWFNSADANPVQLSTETYSLNLHVFPEDTAKVGTYTVRFVATESDETRGNGYFIGGDEVTYSIDFAVLNPKRTRVKKRR